MIELSNITLVCVDCFNYGEAISAIRKSLHQIKPAKTLFFTDIKAYNPNFPFEIVQIDKIDSKEKYSEFIIKKLDQYIETDYVLIIQYDGYVLNGDCWDNRFLGYDYIGAPWLYVDGRNVGNGGFSLRSKKLMNILATDDFIMPLHPEDDCICRTYRHYLELKYGINFSPEDVADKFSYELREPIQNTFGFHGKFHEPYRPVIVVRRSGALGDVVALEPLLEYYHKKNYKVYVDIPLHFAMIYSQHHYTVFHISQLTDKRMPYTLIDLDDSYENNPKQLHLKSYYEKAGITDGEIKNPKLNFEINDQNRLFKKYAIIHNDIRDQASRNIYGVDWGIIVKELNSRGLIVIQAGMSAHGEIDGAIQMKTVTINMLLYLVAGADLFLGIDSGISNIAVSKSVPSIILFGSVNPEYIYPDLSKVISIHRHNENVCDSPFCWSNTPGSFTGTKCYIDDENPPCTIFETQKVIDAINKIL